ncbi:MAG: hypothetical protein ACD_75C00278G0004 [uncultured bacterium]|nr:MAG: hypothetical protein ACD_75C00278G0004 [uncultured bacterium]
MYALRHAFVSTLIRSGVDLRTIADMAGHDVATMLKHYAHGMDETRRNAIAMLSNMHPVGAAKQKRQRKRLKRFIQSFQP